MDNYEVLYGKIVREGMPEKYSDPEEQGKQFRKYSALRSVEIEYSSNNQTKSKNIWL